MATTFKIPDLGENVDSGEVVSLLVKQGDRIAANDPVLELETGKATIEVPSDVAGRITEVHVAEGDTIKAGQVVLTLEAEEGAAEEETSSDAEPEAKDEASDEAGEEAEAKPAADAPAAAERAEPEAKTEPPPAAKRSEPAASSSADRLPVAASPSVRRFAREIGVVIEEVKGTGPNGRLGMEDVKAHAKALLSGGGGGGAPSAAPALPDFSQWGPVELEAMNNVQRMTARHMALCWSTIPHVTQHDKADITALERVRKRQSAARGDAGGKLTLTAILLKFVATALKVHPGFNVSLDMAKSEVVRKQYIHIGVAVDTPKGLVVPVVRDADRKNIRTLATELAELGEKARAGRIQPADLQGGTFTLSNLGGIGGGFFTPIVNHPEVAILGVGRGVQEPVWVDGDWEPRLMLPLSLSYDHRVINGADGARFLRWIVGVLQEPLLMALEG